MGNTQKTQVIGIEKAEMKKGRKPISATTQSKVYGNIFLYYNHIYKLIKRTNTSTYCIQTNASFYTFGITYSSSKLVIEAYFLKAHYTVSLPHYPFLLWAYKLLTLERQ